LDSGGQSVESWLQKQSAFKYMKKIDPQDPELFFDGTDLRIMLSEEPIPTLPEASVVVDIQGTINLYTAQSLNYILDKLIDREVKNLFLNLSKMTYIDSSGLGALMGFHAKFQKLGGYLKLFSPSGTVNKIMEITKLKAILSVYETIEEAIETV